MTAGVVIHREVINIKEELRGRFWQTQSEDSHEDNKQSSLKQARAPVNYQEARANRVQ